MEGRTTPAPYAYRDAERGAGGKLVKRSARRLPATPYDRPPSNLHNRTSGGWLSKFVDPAYRLVTGGATKILPSFLFKSPSVAAISHSTESQDELDVGVIPNADSDEKCTATFDVPKLVERADISEVASGRLESNYESEEREQDRQDNFNDGSEIFKIEQLIKGNFFSRDEINRLMEILNSRVHDLSDVEGGKKNESTTISGHVEAVPPTTFPRTSNEGNQEDMNTALLRTPTPFLPSSVKDEVGESPVEIAKAFMANQISEIGPGPHSTLSKGKTTPNLNDEFDLGPFLPSSSTKSSTCWPGAMVQGHNGYITPSQRGRYGLHDFPRTPYAKAIYSKSRNKLTQLQADSRYQTTSPNPFHQSRTPIFGQVNSRNPVHDDSYGSVGPIRRIRNKFTSEVKPRGSIFLNSSKDAPSPFQPISVSQGLLSTSKKNLEPGETSKHTGRFEEPAPLVNPSSSARVKRILEQLDRNKPTPKEKAAELKLAASWKKSPSGASHSILKDNISLLHPGDSSSLKKADFVEKKLPSEGNKNEGNSKSKENFPERSIEAKDAAATSTKASGIVILDSNDVDAGSLLGLKSNSVSPMKGFKQEASAGIRNLEEKVGPNPRPHKQSNGQHVITVHSESQSESEISKKLQPHSSGTKPVLPYISVGRRDLDNGAGFTFPVSSSSSVISEPPTPSFMPFSSSSTLPHAKEAVPSYSFGTKKSAPSLVFSFPSTSCSTAHVDPSDLKFNFGSDKKTRLSFRSAGKDAICY